VAPYTGSTACLDCLSGSFSSTPGLAACNGCANRTYAPRGSHTCVPCGSGQVTHPVGDSCVNCPAGTFLDPATDDNTCVTCEGNTISGSNATVCDPCLDGSVAVNHLYCLFW